MELPNFRPFQQGIKDAICANPYIGVFLGMGSGKTMITLAALTEIAPPGPVLVVAPRAIAVSTWAEEVAKWNIPVEAVSIDEKPPRPRPTKADPHRMTKPAKRSKAERHALYRELVSAPPKLYTLSVGLLADMVAFYEAEGIAWPFWTVVVDESQTMKNAATAQFKALNTVRPHIGRLILLSGTPAAEELGSLWSQIYLLDRGMALGTTEAGFRARWFRPVAYGPNNQPIKYRLLDGAEKEIYAAIDHLTISQYNIDLKLPSRSIVDIPCALDTDTMDAYHRLKRESVLRIIASDPEPPSSNVTSSARAQHEYKLIADNSATLHNILLQFASGALYLDSDKPEIAGLIDHPDTQATEITSRPTLTVHNAKIAALLELLHDHDGSPVLIAYRFVSECERIVHHLRERGFDARVFDKTAEMKAQWNAGEIPVMLIHPASAGHGLNLQYGGHTMVWFSLPNSAEQYQQTNARLHRIGQTHPVTIYRLLTTGTIDARLPNVLAVKTGSQAALMRALHREFSNVTAPTPTS